MLVQQALIGFELWFKEKQRYYKITKILLENYESYNLNFKFCLQLLLKCFYCF